MNKLKAFIKINILLLLLIISGLIAIYLSYKLIPTSRLEKNMLKSAETIEKIGLNPSIIKNDRVISKLDTFTDSLMLLNAITYTNTSTLNRALLVYRYYDESGITTVALKKVATNNKLDVVSYPRYWHGYLVFLKPLLIFMDYNGILKINTIFQILLVLIVILMLIKKKQYKIIIPYILLILSLIPSVIMKSMQYSSVWYIFNIGIISILLLEKKLKANFFITCIIFTVLGVLTSYFDLLTYPLITLGIPTIIYFTVVDNKKVKKFVQLILTTFFWCYSYGMVWFSKWVIASILTKENVIKNALGAASERTSSEVSTIAHFTRLDALNSNINAFFNGYVLITILLFLLIFIIKVDRHNIKKIRNQLPLVIISFYPVIWYLVLGNHSYIHSWMTNKILGISYFSILIIISNIIEKNKALSLRISLNKKDELINSSF